MLSVSMSCTVEADPARIPDYDPYGSANSLAPLAFLGQNLRDFRPPPRMCEMILCRTRGRIKRAISRYSLCTTRGSLGLCNPFLGSCGYCGQSWISTPKMESYVFLILCLNGPSITCTTCFQREIDPQNRIL
jgi:hypothetical protein